MRVLVTGAGGYVGAAVVVALRAAGHEPVAMTHRDADVVPGGVQVRRADLTEPGTLPAAVRGVDAVCHLAGLTRARESWDRPLDYFAVNAGGTVALLRAMRDAGVGRLVFASTASVYGTPDTQPMTEDLPDDPPHPYAASKVAAEAAIRWSGLPAAALRLFNAAGGPDPDPTRIVPRVLAAAAGETPALAVNGDGSAVRDYLHVADAAEAFVAALRHEGPGLRLFNIGSGAGASVLDVVAAAERVTGRAIALTHNPPAAEPAALVCDPTRARDELGWAPRRSALDDIVRDAWTARAPGARA
ncbi:MAG TPA: NAD-dependent epimerase/dehydratase family protein [Pseudonocardiaceae bacterium]